MTMVKPEILIVDDEMFVRSVLVQVLERYGYAVTEAADGEQALERLKEKKIRARHHRHQNAGNERLGSVKKDQTELS
jgi:CheY-like chemotaxis protein